MNIYLDFDGTLVDISERHYEVYTRCTRTFGGSPISKPEYWDNKRRDMSWTELLDLSGINPIKEPDFLKQFIDLIESPELLTIDKLFNDSLEVLEALSATNNLTLVSLRRNHENLIGQLEHLGVTKYFTSILSGHSDTREGVLLKKAEAIRQTQGYEGGVIVGDAEADISAAKQLQIPSIAITTGIRDREFLTDYEPDYLVDSISEAKQRVYQILSM